VKRKSIIGLRCCSLGGFSPDAKKIRRKMKTTTTCHLITALLCCLFVNSVGSEETHPLDSTANNTDLYVLGNSVKGEDILPIDSAANNTDKYKYANPTDGLFLQVSTPSTLTKEVGYGHQGALFGLPLYGESITHPLYYAGDDDDANFCDSRTVDPTSGYPTRKDNKPWPRPFILMVNRGECSFVQKARVAQSLGAAALIIADNVCLCEDEECTSKMTTVTCEQTIPILADDGSGGDITIPTVMMFKDDADALKKEMRDGNSVVNIEMSWELPNMDSVEYEFWTTPGGDPIANGLQKDWKAVAIGLGNTARFTPHQYIYDGALSGCVQNGENICHTLCTNNGRYCATDPNNNLSFGISGADVVTEGLRRLCIWMKYGEVDDVGVPYWTYLSEFIDSCDNNDHFTDNTCIQNVYNNANIDGTVIDTCMLDSGGTSRDVRNVLLDIEISKAAEREVILLPAIYVNGISFRGSVSASEVFKAVCAGIDEENAPQVCQQCGEACEASRTYPFLFQKCVKDLKCSFDDMNSSNDDTLDPQDTGANIDDVDLMDIDYDINLEDFSGDIDDVDLPNLMDAGDYVGLQDFSSMIDLLPPQLRDCVNLDSESELPPFIQYEPRCSAKESVKLNEKITDLDKCTGWNTVELTEQFPSIAVGIYSNCMNAVANSFLDHPSADDDGTSQKDMQKCTDTIFGDNPFGAIVHDIILNSDKICSCYQHLSDSPLPECQTDHWPIPISGTDLNSVACTISYGCQFVDNLCDSELVRLESCLPPLDEEGYSCDDVVDDCYEHESMLFLGDSAEPLNILLPGACRRVGRESNKGSVLRRYGRFSKKCMKDLTEVWEKKVDMAKVGDILGESNGKDNSIEAEESKSEEKDDKDISLEVEESESVEPTNASTVEDEVSQWNTLSHDLILSSFAFIIGLIVAVVFMSQRSRNLATDASKQTYDPVSYEERNIHTIT